MYFKKSKYRKAYIVLSSAIISLTSVILSCFATTYENPIGASNDVSAVNGQSINTQNQLPTNSIKESKDSAGSKDILLDTPGDYRLIGANSINSNFDPQNENEIIVNSENTISIVGSGEFNIVLDNVNITMNEIQERYYSPCPFKVTGGAQVNLTLEGNNILKNSALLGVYGLFIDDTSTLTITKSSDGSTLDICNDKVICSKNNLVIKGGKIKASSISVINFSEDALRDPKAFGGVLTIKGGNIETSDLTVNNLIVNDGIINATNEIRGDNIIINGGNIYTSNIRNYKMEMINGELITQNINYESYNNNYIRNLEKIFGIFDNNGELIACSTNQINPDDKVIKYLAKMNIEPPEATYVYLDISGGSINGIHLATNNGDYALKDGNNFPSESSRNNYRDTLILFSK